MEDDWRFGEHGPESCSTFNTEHTDADRVGVLHPEGLEPFRPRRSKTSKGMSGVLRPEKQEPRRDELPMPSLEAVLSCELRAPAPSHILSDNGLEDLWHRDSLSSKNGGSVYSGAEDCGLGMPATE